MVVVVTTLELNTFGYEHHYLLSTKSKLQKLHELCILHENSFNLLYFKVVTQQQQFINQGLLLDYSTLEVGDELKLKLFLCKSLVHLVCEFSTKRKGVTDAYSGL